MAKGTKKVKVAKSALSIPELRRGFEHIEEYSRRLVDQLVHKKITRAAAIADYSKEWRRVFHRALPAASAEASIDFAMSAKPARPTRKGHKQRGGMASVGAVMEGQQPGDYAASTLPGQVSPGGYTLYAQVPNYVASGFDALMPRDSHQVLCGIENSTPTLPADLGSNAVSASTMKGGERQKGLKRTRKQRGGNAAIALAFRPLEATNPTGVGYDAQMAWKGGPAPASPDTTDPAFAYRSASAVIPDIKNIGAIDRNMSADVSSV